MNIPTNTTVALHMIKHRRGNAPPGPWEFRPIPAFGGYMVESYGGNTMMALKHPWMTEPLKVFLQHVLMDMDWLIEQVEAQEKERARLREVEDAYTTLYSQCYD